MMKKGTLLFILLLSNYYLLLSQTVVTQVKYNTPDASGYTLNDYTNAQNVGTMTSSPREAIGTPELGERDLDKKITETSQLYDLNKTRETIGNKAFSNAMGRNILIIIVVIVGYVILKSAGKYKEDDSK